MFVRLLLLLVTAVVEALPLALLAGLVTAWEAPDHAAMLAPVPLFVAVLLSFALTRLLQRRGLGERHGRIALVVSAALAAPLLYVISGALDPASPRGLGPALIPALVVLLYAWARGTVLAREDMTFDTIYAAFRQGLIVLFVALVLAVNSGGETAQRLVADGWGRVVLFFLAGLCALSLARVEEERRRGVAPGEAPPVRGEWVLTLLGVALAVGLFGVLLSYFVSPAAAALALAPLGRLEDLLVWALTPLFLLLSLLIDPLIALLRPLFQHRRQINTGPTGTTPSNTTLYHFFTHAQTAAIGRALLLVVGLIVACAVLWYAFYYRQRGASEADGDEERESLWSWALFVAGLRAALRRLWARLFGRPGTPAPAANPLVEATSTPSIRAVYRRLLARMSALGLPRRRDETPHEYLARLRVTVPEGERDAALLTGLYTHARYGPEAPRPDEVAAAGEMWTRLEPALRRLEAEGPTRYQGG